MKAFVSWSGGKECSLSYYRAAQDKNLEIACLLNMVSEDGMHSRTHGISSELLKAQAEAIGVPVIQIGARWNEYEEKFKKALLNLKKEGIHAGVFGDIDLQQHRDWVENACSESGIKPIFPLWGRKRKEILHEFIHSGFQASVVATVTDILPAEYLGQKIDEDFIEKLESLDGVDLCGESGEYHTFVTFGPIFKRKINILRATTKTKDKNSFLNILDYEITD